MNIRSSIAKSAAFAPMERKAEQAAGAGADHWYSRWLRLPGVKP
jgi:hypothetical protein